MFTHRQTSMEKDVVSVVAVLLLLTSAGQSATQTTEAPDLSNSSLTTQFSNSTMEGPRVLRTHKSCGVEHENYCENGGECMYPQDSDKPFCICTSSYSGTRCHFFSSGVYNPPELEKLIGISFGVMMLIVVLAIIFYCCAYKKCIKPSPLIKSAPTESFV
ncbi:epigen-like [Halichoeres trimaculatus]|uniref:epigen-like n=1 Tax=Halichoeres trimaculatus TaxID=147232 RepID=UPI003D9EEC30